MLWMMSVFHGFRRDSSVSRPEVFRSSNSLVSDGQSEASQSATLDPPKQPAHNNSDNHTAAANISNDNVMIGSSPFILDPSILMAPNLPRYDKESPQDVPGPTPTGHMVDIVPSDVTMSDAIPSDVTQSDDTPSGDMPSGDTQSDVTLSRVTLPPTDDDEKQRDEKESGEVETTVEYSLHEYDMVNGTHSVGNSLFYTIANPANSDVFTVGRPTSARIIQNKTSALPTGTAVPPVQLEGAVKLSDKPDLFQSLDGQCEQLTRWCLQRSPAYLAPPTPSHATPSNSTVHHCSHSRTRSISNTTLTRG